MPRRRRGRGVKRYRDLSVCLSLPLSVTAQAIGTLAARRWPATRDVRTADPSADGRRSTESRTAIDEGHTVLPPPQGDNLFAMTSSVKPEGRDISQRHERRRAEPRPWVTCTEYLAKIEGAVPEICSRTDPQANLLITILRSPNPKRPTVGIPGANVLDGGRCAGGRGQCPRRRGDRSREEKTLRRLVLNT